MAAVKNGASYRISATPAIVMAQLLGATVVTLVLVWIFKFRDGLALKSDNKQKIFNVHPTLMVIGFIYLGGQGRAAIMAFKTVPGSRRTQKFVHFFLHMVALVLASIGLYAVITFHNDLGIANFYSLHSWLGIGTFSVYGLQWLLGFFAFVFPGAQSFTRANMVPWHAFLGLVIFILAIVTAETGLTERFLYSGLVHGSQALVMNFAGIAIFLFGMAVILSVILQSS